MTHVLALAESSPHRAAEVGGKTKSLHALISLGLPVPPGFAITAEAYRDVLRATGVQDAITEILSRPGLSDDEISAQIFTIFTSVTLPAALVDEINSAFAAKYLPLRGVSKAGFLMALDAARACSRRVGELLVADGVIDTVDDVFYLTLAEAHHPPADAKDLVAVRRELCSYYRQISLPQEWQGVPSPVVPEIDLAAELITGIPASPGVIEGRVRVIADPSQASVEPGEILVAENTDPSWASIMFLSSGLIADIGGIISHTAVVARELSIPCVVSTQFATKVLHTGDLIRMDGGTGHIQILDRAPSDDLSSQS